MAKGDPNCEVLPVFCFDRRFVQAKVTKFGTEKCGPYRLKFLIEGVQTLRKNLIKIGSQLLVTNELPEVFLQTIISQTPSRYTIIFQKEVCPEEL